jgi:hypothetical protein
MDTPEFAWIRQRVRDTAVCNGTDRNGDPMRHQQAGQRAPRVTFYSIRCMPDLSLQPGTSAGAECHQRCGASG